MLKPPGTAYRQQVDDYAAALDWVAGLITTTEPATLTCPTPCTEWDVRTLIGHLIGTAHRGRATAIGVPAAGVAHVVTDVPDDELGPAYARIAGEIIPTFAGLREDTQVQAPWGEVSALAAVRGFTIETTVHGWDLAVATTERNPRPEAARLLSGPVSKSPALECLFRRDLAVRWLSS